MTDQRKPREFHCIPSRGGDDTGFCVDKSDHGAIKGLAFNVIEKKPVMELIGKLEKALRELYSATIEFDENSKDKRMALRFAITDSREALAEIAKFRGGG
jgi:hypothetical protein